MMSSSTKHLICALPAALMPMHLFPLYFARPQAHAEHTLIVIPPYICGVPVHDKNSEVLYGKRWSILCEEITKLFNEKYQITKGS